MTKKLTPWFPMANPPKRKGMYRCKSCNHLHMWNGSYWIIDGLEHGPKHWFLARSEWRGLAEQPK